MQLQIFCAWVVFTALCLWRFNSVTAGSSGPDPPTPGSAHFVLWCGLYSRTCKKDWASLPSELSPYNWPSDGGLTCPFCTAGPTLTDCLLVPLQLLVPFLAWQFSSVTWAKVTSVFVQALCLLLAVKWEAPDSISWVTLSVSQFNVNGQTGRQLFLENIAILLKGVPVSGRAGVSNNTVVVHACLNTVFRATISSHLLQPLSLECSAQGSCTNTPSSGIFLPGEGRGTQFIADPLLNWSQLSSRPKSSSLYVFQSTLLS